MFAQRTTEEKNITKCKRLISYRKNSRLAKCFTIEGEKYVREWSLLYLKFLCTLCLYIIVYSMQSSLVYLITTVLTPLYINRGKYIVNNL